MEIFTDIRQAVQFAAKLGLSTTALATGIGMPIKVFNDNLRYSGAPFTSLDLVKINYFIKSHERLMTTKTKKQPSLLAVKDGAFDALVSTVEALDGRLSLKAKPQPVTASSTSEAILIQEGVVYKTRNYSLFKNYKGNRKLDKNRVDKIADSMQKRFVPSPILVNEDLMIIDGQYRHSAVSQVGVDLFFIVKDGLTESDIPAFNMKSTNWVPEDFLNVCCELEFPEYIAIRDFMHKYNLPLTQARYFLSGLTEYRIDKTNPDAKSNKLVHDFEAGEFIIQEGYGDESLRIRQFVDIRKLLLELDYEYAYRYVNYTTFSTVLMAILDHTAYSHKNMMTRLSNAQVGKGTKMGMALGLMAQVVRNNREHPITDFRNGLTAIYNISLTKTVKF